MYLSSTRLLPILAISALPKVLAIDIHGQVRNNCDAGQAVVAACRNIAYNTCCRFPIGGLIVQAVWFSFIPECCIGAWYLQGGLTHCHTIRDGVAGFVRYPCLTEGGARAGGGAAWFDLLMCDRADGAMMMSGSKNADVLEEAAGRNCTASVDATMLAFEGEGVWVLEPESEAFEIYNQLLPTTDESVHLANMKKFGTWYTNVDDHPAAAAAVANVAKRSAFVAEELSWAAEH